MYNLLLLYCYLINFIKNSFNFALKFYPIKIKPKPLTTGYCNLASIL